MKLNKNINYRLLVLYLKYGYISLPGFKTIYKNKKINEWIKPPYKINLNTSSREVLLFLKKKLERFVKNQKKKGKYICLMLSSGEDSRLIYTILENVIIKLNYQKNFYVCTGRISDNYTDYDESLIIKKYWNKKPINHQVITINRKEIFKKIDLANKINFQPVNGLPNIIFMECVKKMVKQFGHKKVTMVAGVGDQIFFNASKKQAKLQQKKNYSFVNANEETIFHNSLYLTPKFSKISDQIFKKIKTKNFFVQKHFYHKYINQMAYNYRGPKVITEFINIFKYFKVEHYMPFLDKKFQELVLSLKKNELHNGKTKKTFINNSNKIINPSHKVIPGLKIITPQREILYENRKKILKVINTSILVKQKIIDKKKILENFNNYLVEFVKFKKNKKVLNKFNSYDIWKFLTSEIFLRAHASKEKKILNKKINYRLLGFYLKYGLISLPNSKTIYNKKKILSWEKSKYKTNLNTSSKTCFEYLKKKIDNFVLKQKKDKLKICLMLSSGRDSRLVYNLLESSVKKYRYSKSFFSFTAEYDGFKDYSEYEEIKKTWKKKIFNHEVVKIESNNIFDLISKLNKINNQPINGLPNLMYYKTVERICKKFSYKKVTIVAGIGDLIFFHGDKKNFKKKNNYLNRAHDGTIFTETDYLSRDFSNQIDNFFKKKISIKKFFYTKNQIHDYINLTHFNVRGPKVIHEFKSIFKYFKVKYFAPFVDNKLYNLILSLPLNELFDGKNNKTFINYANSKLGEKFIYSGLRVTTPQREIIYQNKNEILNIIENSILIDLGIIEKKKIMNILNKYLKTFDKLKNTPKYKNLNSFNIWKFLSSELFLRNYERNF